MDARLGILIEESYDAADAAWDKHEKKLHRGLADIGTAHSKITKGMSRDYDMYAAAAMSKVKTVEEYRQDWAGKSTKKLVEYEKELSNERTNLINKLKLNYAEVDTVQTRIHKNRLEQASAELRALKQVSAERKEVQFGGAGALISQLGAGRVTSIFSPLSGIGEMSGGAAAATGIGVGIGAAAAAGAAGVEIFKKMETAAKSYEDGQDRLAIALRRSGEAGAQLRAELAIDSKVVDDLAIEMAKPRAEVAETMGSIAAYSKESGLQLKRTTELVMAIAESTGMEMTRVARMVGKGMNPEVMSDMERLGVHVDKDATQIERLDALEKQYGSTVEGLRDQMQQGEHGWERLKNQLDITIDRFSDKAFDRLTPVFKNLAPEVDRFGDALNNLDLDGFIHRVGNVVHVMEWMIGKTDEQENARREFEARAKNIPYQTVETERKNRKQNNSDEDVLAARAANLGSAPDIPTLTGSYLSDYKKEKGGGKSDSTSKIEETFRAKEWLAQKEAEANKLLLKKEYDSEISFQQQEQLNFAAMTEVQVDDTREAQRIIYEEKKKRLESERDVAKFMYKENTELYDGFTKELSQLDFERSVQLAKNRKEDEKGAKEHSKSILEIDKGLRDKQAELITDKYAREKQQAINWYRDEYKKIQDEGLDLMNVDEKKRYDEQMLLAQSELAQKFTNIQDEKLKSLDKEEKHYIKISDIIKEIADQQKDVNNDTKQWGILVGSVLAAFIERIPEGNSKKDLSKRLSPLDMMQFATGFGDTPGTLAQNSGRGTIPVGNGKYMVIGQGDDKLVQEGKEASNIISYLRQLQQYDSAQFNKNNKRKDLGLQATAIGQLLFQGNGLKSEILSMIHGGETQSDIIATLISSGGTVRDRFAKSAGENIKEWALKKPTEYALEVGLGGPIGSLASKGAAGLVETAVDAFDVGVSHSVQHLATHAIATPIEHAVSKLAADAIVGSIPEFDVGGPVAGTDAGNDPSPLMNLLNGKDPISLGASAKDTKGAITSVIPDVIGALTYKAPPDQYNWNGTKKVPPKHSEALGLLGKIAPIAANLLIPGSGAILGPVLDSLGVNSTGTKKSLFSSSGLAGLSGAGMGLAGGALSFMGLDSGGYTGRGGKYDPAGIVHRGEFVFSSEAVNAIGVGNLDRWHRSARGYESGGYVSNFTQKMPVYQHQESLAPHFKELISAMKSQKLSLTTGDVYNGSLIGNSYTERISL